MKCRKHHGHFLHAEVSLLKRTASPVWCIVGTFSLKVSFASSSACKTVGPIFHCNMVYNHHHNSYIGSTIVLPDIVVRMDRTYVQYMEGNSVGNALKLAELAELAISN